MALADLSTDYAGRKGAMFKLALKTGILTVVTAGFYRFWMKTRMRRYYWSAIRPGGLPLEYGGRPTEKLLGFLTAVVFLAFYIGVVNLVLMFFSFSLFQGNAPAYAVSLVGITPLIFFAQYRARRYVLARTRWRGIRFGLEPGVAGFVWRSILHWGLTAMTAGLYWPVKTFWLEKYRTDRTFYGNARMHQGGRWFMLYPATKHIAIGAVIVLVTGAIIAWQETPALAPLTVIGAGWMVFGIAYYKANAFKRLTDAKTLGDIGLCTAPRAGRVLGIYTGGWAAISGVLFGALMVVGIIMGLVLAATGFAVQAWLGGEDLSSIPAFVPVVFGLVVYFGVFIFYGVLKEVFITLPMAEHFAEETRIVNAHLLNDIHQRDRDEFGEAEGFADALPLGDAF